MPANTIAFLPDDPLANRICPYPGLRPFNEEESIFFKGRETHIEQIIRQLEQRKFLMLTGASGDGKSSIVYAGVIPNARAGFFKAKHNNWAVADFRPERSPLKNFAASICKTLSITSLDQTEKELSYGFSALIDIYKASSSYLDQSLEEFKNLDEPEKKKRKRKASNLLILVDQFEEFFTNTENYPDGRPSFAAQAVMNVLLETARIALENDIPIYIICTMRSDYIGPCAAFRGLPEYIGYSQFFVPRLNRRELYQVIEEPALLNGDKISKRLVETLISKLDEGIDQLPVLQHALSQIWHCAGMGVEELDLLHFAKVGGLDRKYLNATDKAAFERWLPAVPDFKLPFFAHPSLDNVLDTHANELFERAAGEVHGKYQNEKVSDRDAKLIIETAFKCLTKIDEGRAVRNRMTLQEITQIINRKDLTVSQTGKILNIFRRQGNTFLKPFITEAPETEDLDAAIVLDITHESLIRNWAQLTDWARHEYEDFLNFQDFNKQLQRWVNNQRSTGYLLPIGPLTFFEDWFKKAKPNRYWLVKYDQRNISYDQKLAEAERTLLNASEFLRKSARKLFVNRAIIKYGANKIIAAFGLLFLFVSCTYFTFDFRKKQNEYVAAEMEAKGKELLSSKYINNDSKAIFIITEERLHPGAYRSLLTCFNSDSEKMQILRSEFLTTFECQKNKKSSEKDIELLGSIIMTQFELFNKSAPFTTTKATAQNINNILALTFEHIALKKNKYHFQEKKIDENYQAFRGKALDASLKLLSDTSLLGKLPINDVNKLIQTLPELCAYDSSVISQIVDKINPFGHNVSVFNKLYPREQLVKQYEYSGTITHNGGYYELCNLFALSGNIASLSRSYDSLMKYDEAIIYSSNFGYSYQRLLTDLLVCNKLTTNEGMEFVKKIKCTKYNEFSLLMLLQDELSFRFAESVDGNMSGASDHILLNENAWGSFPDFITLDRIIALQDYLIRETSTRKADNYQFLDLALLYKSKAYDLAWMNAGTSRGDIDSCLSKYIFFARKMDKAFQAKEIAISNIFVKRVVKISYLVNYPVCISINLSEAFTIPSPDWLKNVHNRDIVSDYCYRNKLIDSAFSSAEYTNNYFFMHSTYALMKSAVTSPQDLISAHVLEAILQNSRYNPAIDTNLLFAELALYYERLNDSAATKKYLAKINFSTILTRQFAPFDMEGYRKVSPTYTGFANSLTEFLLSKKASRYLNMEQAPGKVVDSIFIRQFVKGLPINILQRNVLLHGIEFSQAEGNDALSIALTDTLLNRFVQTNNKYGNKFFEVLGRYGTLGCNTIARQLMKIQEDENKLTCLAYMIRGVASTGNYYSARSFIPDYASLSNQLDYYSFILQDKIVKSGSNLDGWSSMDERSNPYLDYETGLSN